MNKKKDEPEQQELDANPEEQTVEVETLEDPELPVGVILAKARKALDKSIDQIADELNLSAATIRAIETQQTDGLPELTYVRGYIRSYARLLGLDAEKMVTAYSSDGARVSYDELPQGLSEEDFQVSSGRSGWFKWVILVAILALAAYFIAPASLESFRTGDRTQSATSNTSSQDNRVTQTDAIDGAPTSVERLSLSDEQASEVVLESSIEESDDASAAEPQDTATQASAPLENTLVLAFTATRWLDVRDSNNTRLAYNSVAGGNEVVLSSALEMSVYIDNIDGVTATLNGEPYDLSEFRQGTYAKFIVAAP